jgi:hypothetical protein
MISSGEIRSIRLIGDSITAGLLCDGFDVYPDADVVVYSGAQGTYQETAPEVACWANDFRAYAARRGVGSFVNAGVSGFRMEFLAAEPDALPRTSRWICTASPFPPTIPDKYLDGARRWARKQNRRHLRIRFE